MTQALKEVAQLRIELDDLKKKAPSSTKAMYPPPDKADLDDLKGRLGKIEDALGKLSSVPQTVLSPARVGRLRLVNEYHEELLFIVNGRSYRVAPGSTQQIEQVPTGAFTYEVIS